jgi:hypothetical protein
MKMHCINEKTAYDSKILNLKNNFSHHSVISLYHMSTTSTGVLEVRR